MADGKDIPRMTSGGLKQTEVGIKLERARETLIDALDTAGQWHAEKSSTASIHAVGEIASSLKKIRKLESDLLKA